MTTGESKDRFLSENESIRIDSLNVSNRIDPNHELECSTQWHACICLVIDGHRDIIPATFCHRLLLQISAVGLLIDPRDRIVL